MIHRDRFISRACPLMFGAHHPINYPIRGWLDDDKKLPHRLRCKGFRGILMVLGTLVYIAEESSGYSSFSVSREKVKEPFSHKQQFGPVNFAKPSSPSVVSYSLKRR
ncbi:hypothetical protein [Estrella lausannensis]|uniref:Uncharacterized protein n=1 Tax=Estrella lausannensis TaxID=483423 RepID=A0A0H5DRP5_9BACT|nr:hypothetical protein [Estrella lausannensis]CRX39272.1 Hypothetical protein ELAC_1948 [Estrella lausannensis]